MYDLYSCSPDDRSRFILGHSGAKKLLVVGLNPSTATQEKSDTTVAKVQEVARLTGFDGFVMLNLYPVRATDFKTLPLDGDLAAIEQNLAAIEAVVRGEEQPVIWAAWGQSILARGFFISAAKQLAVRLSPYSPMWQHHGPLTKNGHPRHPSRLNYASKFSPFKINAYVNHPDA